MGSPPRIVLLDFDTDDEIALWGSVDDGVMGGASHSRFSRAAPGVARFSGVVSLENNGGFASIRTLAREWPTADATALALRVRGDGKTYKFTVRTDDRFDGVQYQVRFTPPIGEWFEAALPAASFAASFRGRTVAGAPALDLSRVRALGLMISDKQAGPFELLVDWIAAVG
jgi:NADH dehydrogenase [ubiquinone] 1 alpha subcomplex assembly factor 1